MKKRMVSSLLCVSMVAAALSGCGSKGTETTAAGGSGSSAPSGETIKLTVWAAEEDQNLTAARVEKFKEANPDQNFEITLGVESEGTAKDTILADPEAAPDVFAFASDQIVDLVNASVLQEVQDVETISSENMASSVEAATIDGVLYAYPLSADNGYFLFYDSAVVSAEDAKSWDTILEACAAADKSAGMVLASGWYNAGFFYGAGFETIMNADGSTTIDWNKTSASGIKGVDVAAGILAISNHEAFFPITDGDTTNQIASGKLGAVISGTWDAVAAQEAFGEGYQATVLPTFACGGQQVQMGDAAGFKMIGVSKNSAQVGWAMELAKFLSNQESQEIRFTERGNGPSNIEAAKMPEIQENAAIAAITAQNELAGVVQQVGGNFWDPAKSFGEILAQGNPDGTDLQVLLDNLAEAAAQPNN